MVHWYLWFDVFPMFPMVPLVQLFPLILSIQLDLMFRLVQYFSGSTGSAGSAGSVVSDCSVASAVLQFCGPAVPQFGGVWFYGSKVFLPARYSCPDLHITVHDEPVAVTGLDYVVEVPC